MVPMVHLLESQERDRLLDGDANGRGFCMWDCGLVKLKSSECVSVRPPVAQQKEQRRYELLSTTSLIRLVEIYRHYIQVQYAPNRCNSQKIRAQRQLIRFRTATW